MLLLSSFAVLPSCNRTHAIRVGSKNFTESIVIAEIYAQALERAGIRVERRLNLGSTQIALAAMKRGDIDLYPEYTGTALIDVLHHAPLNDARAIYKTVSAAFRSEYDMTWLRPSPMNDSQGLATTAAVASQFNLKTLSDLAEAAPKLRLAAIPEFLTRADGLPGLQKLYGGFHFATVHTYDIALKYDALLTGAADVATAFTTDGTIATKHLIVLEDNKHLWPAYNVCPVVRNATLQRTPNVAAVLNAIATRITNDAAQRMNASVEDGGQDPADVAAAFLKGSVA